MSALRISRPGIVGTTLIDLGPDRPFHARGAIPGGMLVTAQKPKPLPIKPTSGRDRERMREYRARVAAETSCGRELPLAGGTCARKAKHAHSCRSALALQAAAEQRRGSRIPADVERTLR